MAKIINLVMPKYGPPKRGAPSDVRRWPKSFTLRCSADSIEQFKVACWKHNREASDVLREFMDAFIAQYADKETP